MTCDEMLEQAQRDQHRMEAANLENARQQAAINAFNETFQAIWAVHCAQLSMLVYRGMFDPTFCAPTALGKSDEY